VIASYSQQITSRLEMLSMMLIEVLDKVIAVITTNLVVVIRTLAVITTNLAGKQASN